MKCVQDELAIYQIRVGGELDPCWSEWFDDMNVVPQRNGETVLVGLVQDQAALHRLLDKVRDIGLPLLSVNRIDRGISLASRVLSRSV